jgi:hypothetical protein
MSDPAAAEQHRARPDVRATSVGQPMAVSSLARLLLKLHREPVLQLVTTTTGDDDRCWTATKQD